MIENDKYKFKKYRHKVDFNNELLDIAKQFSEFYEITIQELLDLARERGIDEASLQKILSN